MILTACARAAAAPDLKVCEVCHTAIAAYFQRREFAAAVAALSVCLLDSSGVGEHVFEQIGGRPSAADLARDIKRLNRRV